MGIFKHAFNIHVGLSELLCNAFGLSLRYSTSDKGRVGCHIAAFFGRMPIYGIARSDVERMVSDIAASKTAADGKTALRGRGIVRGGEGVAKKSCVSP